MNLSQLFSIFTAAGQAPTASSYIMTFVPLALILVFFYFFIIKPQKKQEKQDREMRDSLEIKDDTVVVETGGDRSKIRVMKWAIAKVVSDKDEENEKEKA